MPTKSGYITIIGKPNAGKSTLMNALLGQKLSIITNKPQTTRKRVLGILNGDDYQMIFLDTPGILRAEYLLQERMLDYISESINDADVILYLIDAENDPEAEKLLSDEIASGSFRKNRKKIAVINKVDLSNEEKVKSLIKKLESKNIFNAVVPVAAAQNYNLDRLTNIILDYLPEGPIYFPDDQISDENERFFVSEIIREKIFEIYRDEIPYSAEVQIDEFKERDGRKDYISASIIVERDSQKPILIGKKGDSIKKLGQLSRKAMEQFLERDVFLELRVKVRDKWRSDPRMLKYFGYRSKDEN